MVIDGGYCNYIMSFYQTGTNSYLSLSDSILMFGASLHLLHHHGYQKSVFTARQKNLGKVMFSQVFVCPQGVGYLWSHGRSTVGRYIWSHVTSGGWGYSILLGYPTRSDTLSLPWVYHLRYPTPYPGTTKWAVRMPLE